jgi:hypothetical protein
MSTGFSGILRAGNGRKIRPKQVVEEVLLQNRDGAFGRRHDERRAVVLHAVVGDGRQIADMVEMRVTDEARLQPALRFQGKTARQRAGIEREIVVDEKCARPMFGSLPTVTANDAKIHASTSALWRGRYPRAVVEA